MGKNSWFSTFVDVFSSLGFFVFFYICDRQAKNGPKKFFISAQCSKLKPMTPAKYFYYFYFCNLHLGRHYF